MNTLKRINVCTRIPKYTIKFKKRRNTFKFHSFWKQETPLSKKPVTKYSTPYLLQNKVRSVSFRRNTLHNNVAKRTFPLKLYFLILICSACCCCLLCFLLLNFFFNFQFLIAIFFELMNLFFLFTCKLEFPNEGKIFHSPK